MFNTEVPDINTDEPSSEKIQSSPLIRRFPVDLTLSLKKTKQFEIGKRSSVLNGLNKILRPERIILGDDSIVSDGHQLLHLVLKFVVDRPNVQ